MNDDARLMFKVADLALASLNGTLDDIGLRQLEELLENNPLAVEYFQSILWTCVGLNSMEGIVSLRQVKEGVLDREFWDTLSVEEKEAQKIELAEPEPDRQPLRTDVHPKPAPTVSKFSIYSLLLSSAALIFLIVYAYFVSMNGGIEVATLADSLQARWADTKKPLPAGTRLTTGKEWFLLREGCVKLLFDKGARVVIEAPAEFQILADDRIGLLYGKAYATVPQGAIGFSIYTKNAKVIDLGTEFGIDVDSRGDTCLHVIKGQTRLIAGEKSDTVSLEVGQGTAKKVTDETQSVTDIPCRTNLFVRAIDSKTSTIWRGQKQLKLADYVGGGNGFGTGLLNYGIHPVTGESGVATTANRPAGNTYMRLPRHPFVDGVFVPNGKDKQEISSRGHVFQECPVTQGNYFMEVINTPALLDGQVMTLNGIPYNTRENPCLFLHANIGITFDLDAIRSRVPGASIVSFQSQVGISETALRDPNADFWVLVDGELRYRKEHVQQKGLLDMLRIELSDTDRFLTLVVTDGGDPGARELPSGFIRQSIDCDWGVFADPVLILE